jgi:hypothetical protein
VIARETGLPLVMVQAVVNRLEEFANKADHRGHVGGFTAEEFAAAHEISPDEAARIFAALERRGWIAFEHIATFHDRNPDREDETVAERKRRQRSRERAMKELARQAAAGLITAEERQLREIELLADARLSTGHGSHIVTPRDIVTVTPEQNTHLEAPPVDKSGDGAGGTAAGLGNEEQGAQGEPVHPQVQAELWLLSTGLKIVIERMSALRPHAENLIGRWRRNLNDDATLVAIIVAADRLGKLGEDFRVFVNNQVFDAMKAAARGPQLALGPVAIEPKRGAG